MGDLYGLLGLSDKTYEAGQRDIEKAYKKLALIYHPDKLGDAYTDKDKEMWLSIQSAYETLSDPAKRKRYDSSLPFDDEVPSDSDDITDEDFYSRFEPVFKNNSMWSKKKPAPNLGDDDTPLDEVKRFYKFWSNFDTWREFSQYDEYDPTEAQDRYERRYMENENRKLRKEHERAERKRLNKLVDGAYRRDPRIRKEQEMIEREKQLKKERFREAKEKERLAREEAERKEREEKEEAERKKKEVAEKVAEEKKNKQKLMRQSAKALLEMCLKRMPGTKYDKFYCEELIKKVKTTEKMQEITEKLAAIPESEPVPAVVEQFLVIVDNITKTAE